MNFNTAVGFHLNRINCELQVVIMSISM